VIDNGWQALIVSLEPEKWSKHLDFMRLESSGAFYLQRVLQDDLSERVSSGEVLDAILVVIRIAEAIAVALSMVKALGWSEDAILGMEFKWTGLNGRRLDSWANPMVLISGGESRTEFVQTYVEIPLNVSLSAIAPFVQEAAKGLFVVFNGFTLPQQAIEDWTQKLIERRL
jgi:hypothetical protein